MLAADTSTSTVGQIKNEKLPVAFDLDGVLISDRDLSTGKFRARPKIKQELSKLKAAGCLLGICSSASQQHVDEVRRAPCIANPAQIFARVDAVRTACFGNHLSGPGPKRGVTFIELMISDHQLKASREGLSKVLLRYDMYNQTYLNDRGTRLSITDSRVVPRKTREPVRACRCDGTNTFLGPSCSNERSTLKGPSRTHAAWGLKFKRATTGRRRSRLSSRSTPTSASASTTARSLSLSLSLSLYIYIYIYVCIYIYL